MKKYELTQNVRKIGDTTLHQIKALKNFGYIKAGELGGYIEKENNLSQEGKAWVHKDAMVYDAARVYEDASVSDDAMVAGCAEVYGNAKVYDNALVFGNARVYDGARVFGDAVVFGDARVFDSAQVFTDARVHGDARVYGASEVCSEAEVYGDARVYDLARICESAKVYGKAKVFGNAWVFGDANVSGEAEVSAFNHTITIGPISSPFDIITFYRNKYNSISVSSVWFSGSIDNFVTDVNTTRGDSEHAKAYILAAELAKTQIDLSQNEKDIRRQKKSAEE